MFENIEIFKNHQMKGSKKPKFLNDIILNLKKPTKKEIEINNHSKIKKDNALLIFKFMNTNELKQIIENSRIKSKTGISNYLILLFLYIKIFVENEEKSLFSPKLIEKKNIDDSLEKLKKNNMKKNIDKNPKGNKINIRKIRMKIDIKEFETSKKVPAFSDFVDPNVSNSIRRIKISGININILFKILSFY